MSLCRLHWMKCLKARSVSQNRVPSERVSVCTDDNAAELMWHKFYFPKAFRKLELRSKISISTAWVMR